MQRLRSFQEMSFDILVTKNFLLLQIKQRCKNVAYHMPLFATDVMPVNSIQYTTQQYLRPAIILGSVLGAAAAVYFAIYADQNKHMDYAKIFVHVAIALAVLANAIPANEDG